MLDLMRLNLLGDILAGDFTVGYFGVGSIDIHLLIKGDV
jgi:hypothetical protein